MNPADALRLVALGAIWGSSFAFLRVAVPEFGPVGTIAIRLALAALLLSAAALAFGRPRPAARLWPHFAILGAAQSAVPFLMFAIAATQLPAALLAVFNALAPICGAAVARLWLGTRLGRMGALGLALGFAGVAIVAVESLAQARIAGAPDKVALALLAALAGPICYGVSATYVKWRAAESGPFDNAHASLWMAAAMLAPFALAAPFPGTPQTGHWLAVAALGLLCTGVAALLNFRLIADLGPARALTVTFLIPPFGALWGALFLAEMPGPGLILGGTLAVLGTALANQRTKAT